MSDAAEFKTACAVLGLSGTVSARDAKAAFRLRAALLHPDVHHAAGDERTLAATAAMQQLNDAYQLVLGTLEKDRSMQTADVDPTTTKLRCTRCRNEFRVPSGDLVASCPRCAQRLRVQPWESRPSRPQDDASDREIVYRTREWAANMRTVLDLALIIRGVSHSWDDNDLVIDTPDEPVVDRCVQQVDALATTKRRRWPSSTEVCYGTTAWSQLQLQSTQDGLRCLGCDFYFDNGEIVVDKGDEPRVDQLVALLIDDASDSPQ